MCVCFQRRLRPPPPPLFFWTPQNETSNPFKKQKRPFVFPNRADFFRTRRLRTSSKTHLCPHKKKAETEIFREEEHDNNDNNDNNTGCTVVSSKKTNSGTRERERRSRFFFRRAMIGDHDGYKWRKYGQKNIKSASYPRSYYRCTRPDCPARKQVENGVAKYENEHNHEKPSLLLHSQKTDLHRAKSGKVEKKKSKGAMMMSHARCMSSIFFFFFVDFLFGCRFLSFDRSIEMNKKTVRVLLTDRESRAQTSSIQSIDRSIDTKQDAHPECTRPATRKLKHRKRRGSFTKKRKME